MATFISVIMLSLRRRSDRSSSSDQNISMWREFKNSSPFFLSSLQTHLNFLLTPTRIIMNSTCLFASENFIEIFPPKGEWWRMKIALLLLYSIQQSLKESDETCCHHYVAKGQKKSSYITHRCGKVNGGSFSTCLE